jgi:phosphomevalonate kinase
VAVSAPGKVLFAGGFLVLDRTHTGLVFGLNARIHVHVQEDERPADAQGAGLSLAVHSPQFKQAQWRYVWSESEGRLKQVKK